MPHLQPNHGSALPSRCVFLHCDAKEMGGWQELNAGVAKFIRIRRNVISNRSEQVFVSPVAFWRFLESVAEPKATTWVVSHNLPIDLRMVDLPSRFDADRRALNGGAGMCVLGDPPNILCVSLDRGRLRGDWIRSERKGKEHYRKIVFVDIRNWTRQPIEGIGNMLGMERDHIAATPRTIGDSVHNCNETIAILQAAFCKIIEFNRINSLGNFRFTAAGQAMAAFKHGRMPTKIVVRPRKQENGKYKDVPVLFGCIHPPDEPKIKELERRAYYGGQVECWRIGDIEGKWWHLDANSLYLSVMRKHSFPVKVKHDCLYRKFSTDRPDFAPSNTVCEVYINAQHGRYPQRRGMDVVFPIGRYYTVLAGKELERANQSGDILEYGKWTEYHVSDCLEPFASEMLSMRDRYRSEGDEFCEGLTKLVGNALSGKFAEKSGAWENVEFMRHLEPFEQTTVINAATNTIRIYRRICDTVQRKVDKSESKRSFPAIAAFITAYGREQMLSYRKIAGHENVAYQGTDSLIVNKSGYDRLVHAECCHPTIPGKLKIKQQGTGLVIKACGVYALDGAATATGIKPDAIPLGENLYQQREFHGVNKLFHSKEKTRLGVDTRIIESKINYVKGIVASDGKVSPLVLDEGRKNE